MISKRVYFIRFIRYFLQVGTKGNLDTYVYLSIVPYFALTIAFSETTRATVSVK